MRIFLHCESNERSFFCVSFTINIDSISQRNGIVSLRKAKLIGTRQPCQGWSQGFELNVLKGAQNTLTTNNPVLCVEEDDPKNSLIIPFLKILKYELVDVIGKEHIFIKK